MAAFLFDLSVGGHWATALAGAIGADPGVWHPRRFPDREYYVRVESAVQGSTAILLSSLDAADDKILPLYFLAATLRDLGAKRIFLVAPYLGYLRQDARFQPGEGLTSRYFAALLSGFLDGIVTVDPHLHRYAALSEIYTIPAIVVHAAPQISAWIRQNVRRPVLIGPDRESEQWVSEVATMAGAPFVVMDKVRKGDRDVEIRFPSLAPWQGHTPVIVDDIISSGTTMVNTLVNLKEKGLAPAVCLGIHAIFSGNAHHELLASGAAEIATCNTIPHPTNRVDLTSSLAEAVSELLKPD